MMMPMSKPVSWMEAQTTAMRIAAISGVRERGRCTAWPFGSVMVSGLKIRSNSGTR